MNDVKDLSKERRRVGVGDRRSRPRRSDQVKLRERHAFVSAKLADLERQPRTRRHRQRGLQAQRDAGELEREDKRLELDAAISTAERTRRWLAS